MPDPCRRKVRIVYKREGIHKDTLAVVGFERICTLDVKRIEITYFGDRFPYAAIGSPVLQEKMCGQFLRGYGFELLKVLECHRYVYIIIPRNEPSMAHSSQKTAPIQPIFYALTGTNAVDFR